MTFKPKMDTGWFFNLRCSPMRDQLQNVGWLYSSSDILSLPVYSKGRAIVPVYSTVGEVDPDPSVISKSVLSIFSTIKGT